MSALVRCERLGAGEERGGDELGGAHRDPHEREAGRGRDDRDLQVVGRGGDSLGEAGGGEQLGLGEVDGEADVGQLRLERVEGREGVRGVPRHGEVIEVREDLHLGVRLARGGEGVLEAELEEERREGIPLVDPPRTAERLHAHPGDHVAYRGRAAVLRAEGSEGGWVVPADPRRHGVAVDGVEGVGAVHEDDGASLGQATHHARGEPAGAVRGGEPKVGGRVGRECSEPMRGDDRARDVEQHISNAYRPWFGVRRGGRLLLDEGEVGRGDELEELGASVEPAVGVRLEECREELRPPVVAPRHEFLEGADVDAGGPGGRAHRAASDALDDVGNAQERSEGGAVVGRRGGVLTRGEEAADHGLVALRGDEPGVGQKLAVGTADVAGVQLPARPFHALVGVLGGRGGGGRHGWAGPIRAPLVERDEVGEEHPARPSRVERDLGGGVREGEQHPLERAHE